MKLSQIATSIIALTVAMPAMAQDQNEQKDDFHGTEEIVVTAPYFERLDLLSGTSAITGENLAEASRGQIGDTLTALPGISATSFSPGASRPVLRGFQGNRVAVLTDGIGNIDASNTSTDHAVTIETLTTERIEVLRGPAVLLFGGQAVGGAVNAIDKRIPRGIPKDNLHLDFIGGYGSAANERSAGGSIDAALGGGLVGHIDASYRKSGDLRTGGRILSAELRADTLIAAGLEQAAGNLEAADALRDLADLTGKIPNSGVETWTAGLGATYFGGSSSLGISGSMYDTFYGVPGRPGGEESVSIDLRQYRFDVRGEFDTGEGFIDKIKLRSGYADYEHVELEGTAVGTRFLSHGTESRLELIQSEKNGWRGASGVQYLTRKFEAIGEEAFVPANRSTQFGMFTFQEIPLGGLQFEASLRHDWANLQAVSINADKSFSNLSAALGFSYSSGLVKVGVNGSRTGRAPSAEELFSNGPHAATQAFEVGDVTLKSEKSWNGEVYARFDNGPLEISATIYSNWFDGFIFEAETGATVDDLPEFRYRQSKARHYGAEVEVSAKLAQFGAYDLYFDGVADTVRATLSNSGGNVPRIPSTRLLGGLELRNDIIELRGEFEWVDAQSRVAALETVTKGYQLVNASVNWRPWGKARNVNIALSANNIFDVSARRAASVTKDFVPLSGRDIRLTARLSF